VTKDKRWSTKHYRDSRLSNTNHTKNRGRTHVIWKGKLLLI